MLLFNTYLVLLAVTGAGWVYTQRTHGTIRNDEFVQTSSIVNLTHMRQR